MIEYVQQRMEEWTRLGTQEGANGSRIFAHTPRDFPQAYLHTFFGPLPNRAWKRYGIRLPERLAQLYAECNGLRLFGGAIDIYGIREHYKRDESAAFQPFDLKTHDNEHRTVFHPIPRQQSDDRVFFGSYSYDGSGIYATHATQSVYRCVRGECSPVNEWPDVEAFLRHEYDRLDSLYSEDGYLIDDEIPTVPAST